MSNAIMERFAVGKAVEKAMQAARTDADTEMWRIFDSTGADRITLDVCGEKVGTFSVVRSKDRPVITDQTMFENWLVTSGLGDVQFYLNEDAIPQEELDLLYEQHPEWFVKTVDTKWFNLDKLKQGPDGTCLEPSTGEIVPGTAWHVGMPTSTRYSGCKPEVVFDIMARHGLGAESILGLLSGTTVAGALDAAAE